MLQYGERQQDEVRHSMEDRCRDDAEIIDCHQVFMPLPEC